jgi:gliding motility-associated-like protein
MRLLLISLTVLLSLLSREMHATHVRAGEITAKRISESSLTYEIKFTGYYNMDPAGITAARATSDVWFWISGDNRSYKTPRVGGLDGMIDVGNLTSRNEYVLTYTFPAPGVYSINLGIDNRVADVLNIGPPPTDRLNFFIQSKISINVSLGMNRTPVLLNSPIDQGAVGQRYVHNPGAFDADGDSLSYKMHIPLGATSDGKTSIPIDYRDPNTVPPVGAKEDGTGTAEFSIDPITGDLVWDAPSVMGWYNVAFMVEEWRNGTKIGEIVRDMQIKINEAPNNRPALAIPPDLCIEAGTVARYTVTATDPDGDVLRLTSTGGVYQSSLVDPQLASFQAGQAPPLGTATGVFTWATGCAHIREEAYEITFKVEDAPRPGYPNPDLFRKLVDMVTLRIKVYAPAPKNLRAVATDTDKRAFQLSWDPYSCQVPGAQIVVYRKEGCSDLEIDECQTGLPENSGYVAVARLAATATSYLDDGGTEPLKGGISYSYRLVARIPRHGALPTEPNRFVGGTESVASEQACDALPSVTPLLTNVTIDQTDAANGQVTVRWTRPQGIEPGAGAPFEYRLYRADGLGGGSYGNTPVAVIPTSHQRGALDTLFVDRNLNTLSSAYHYKLEYWITKGGVKELFDVTEPASTVRLSQGGGVTDLVKLDWAAQVPWDNVSGMVHHVYRKNAQGVFNKIAEVPVVEGEFTYTDNGADLFAQDGDISTTIDPNQVYCYRVETVGSYNSPQVRPDLLYNFSQELCASPSDDTKPCAPVLELAPLDCESFVPADCQSGGFVNDPKWTYPETCDVQSVTAYNIYFARYEGDPFVLVGTVAATQGAGGSFLHQNLSSYAGCYYVKGVNRFGEEGPESNIVCRDNCPLISFPNAFSPNGDGKNDQFKPIGCPTFVIGMKFRVYNRWGALVWQSEGTELNWDGKNTSGIDLPAGQYFYECEATIESTSRGGRNTTIKGWIQLLR